MTKTYLSFDNMCWPNPDDPAGIEWALRYGEPTREQQMIAASFIGAYQQLVTDSQQVRNGKVARIRTARNAVAVEPTKDCAEGESRSA